MHSAYEKSIQNQFGGFCVKVLKNEARKIQNEHTRQQEREVSLDDLSPADLEQISCEDQYFSGEHTFEVDGLPVVVIGDTLAKAIAQLSPEKREVILLSYFLGMSDREISQRLNVVRQTITKRRNAALKILRNYLTEEGQE